VALAESGSTIALLFADFYNFFYVNYFSIFFLYSLPQMRKNIFVYYNSF